MPRLKISPSSLPRSAGSSDRSTAARSILLAFTKSPHRPFTSAPPLYVQNRIYDPIRIPPTFHDYLRTCSTSNTLLLALFTTDACTPCRTISPLLQSLLTSRPPSAQDKFSSLAFAELELDSPDTSNGPMSDLGVEWGIRSLPTLVGFGGRRAERVTDRLADTKMLGDSARMQVWIDDQMAKGDPSGSGGAAGGGGLLARIFG